MGQQQCVGAGCQLRRLRRLAKEHFAAQNIVVEVVHERRLGVASLHVRFAGVIADQERACPSLLHRHDHVATLGAQSRRILDDDVIGRAWPPAQRRDDRLAHQLQSADQLHSLAVLDLGDLGVLSFFQRTADEEATVEHARQQRRHSQHHDDADDRVVAPSVDWRRETFAARPATWAAARIVRRRRGGRARCTRPRRLRAFWLQ